MAFGLMEYFKWIPTPFHPTSLTQHAYTIWRWRKIDFTHLTLAPYQNWILTSQFRVCRIEYLPVSQPKIDLLNWKCTFKRSDPVWVMDRAIRFIVFLRKGNLDLTCNWKSIQVWTFRIRRNNVKRALNLTVETPRQTSSF